MYLMFETHSKRAQLHATRCDECKHSERSNEMVLWGLWKQANLDLPIFVPVEFLLYQSIKLVASLCNISTDLEKFKCLANRTVTSTYW